MSSLGAFFWTGVAALSTYRALVRPVRAVFDSGEITGCPAASQACEPVLTIRSSTGIAPVYALVSGVVSRVIPGKLVELVSDREPVVVSYVGPLVANMGAAQVAPGQRVRAGQVLGQVASIGIAVSMITRLADGSLALKPMEPTSWLAARGLRPATRVVAGTKWCDGGRTLVVPQDVVKCGMTLPEPSGFSLLPVNVRLA